MDAGLISMVMTDTNFRESLLPGKHELKPPPTPEKRTKQKPRICLEKTRFCWRQREEREDVQRCYCQLWIYSSIETDICCVTALSSLTFIFPWVSLEGKISCVSP